MLGLFRTSIVLLIFGLLALAAAAEYPKAFVGKPETRDVSLSPDGGSVALLNTGYHRGVQQVAGWDEIEIKSTDTGEQTFLRDTEEWLYSWVYWAFDDVIIANGVKYSWSRFSGTKAQPQLIAINPKTGQSRVLSKGRRGSLKRNLRFPKLIGIDAEKRSILAIQPDGAGFSLVSINVDRGATKKLDRSRGNVRTWFLNDQNQPVIKVVRNKAGSVDHYYRRVGGAWKIFFNHDLLGNDFAPVSQGRDSNTYYVMARPEGAERTGLYLFDLKEGVFKERIYEHSKFDLAGAYADIAKGTPKYAAFWSDNYEKHWFDPAFQEKGAKISEAFGGATNWSLLETTDDNQTWLIYVSSPVRPGDYFVYQSEERRLRAVSRRRAGIQRSKMSPPEKITYQARDGTELFGYFTPARNGSADSPLIVIPHGGPVARDTPDWDGWAQFFAFKGYSVFQPQFRGSGGFGLQFEQAGFGKWGEEMQWDIYDGVSTLVERDLVNATSPRSIVGASYGGYAALTAVTMAPDAFSCAVSLNGVSSLPAMLRQYQLDDPVEKYVKSIWEARFGMPTKSLAELDAVSPITHVEAIKAPIFLLHGTEDQIVAYEQSQSFAEAAEQAGKWVQLVKLEGVGHRNYSDDVNTEILIQIDRFMQQCMPLRQ